MTVVEVILKHSQFTCIRGNRLRVMAYRWLECEFAEYVYVSAKVKNFKIELGY